MNQQEHFSSSEESDTMKQFLEEQGADYMNFDAQIIKQRLLQQHQLKMQIAPQIDAQEPEKPLNFIPVKNHIESTWPEEDDTKFQAYIKGKQESEIDWSELIGMFKQSEKDVKYHYQVLQQLWTIQQQSELLSEVQSQFKTSSKINWKVVSERMGKTKTQCQKHYQKLIETCWTEEMDQQILRVVERNFQKEISPESFGELQPIQLIAQQQIFERYLVLKKKSEHLDRFWFKASIKALEKWWELNQSREQRTWPELWVSLPEYNVFDVERFLASKQ